MYEKLARVNGDVCEARRIHAYLYTDTDHVHRLVHMPYPINVNIQPVVG